MARARGNAASRQARLAKHDAATRTPWRMGVRNFNLRRRRQTILEGSRNGNLWTERETRALLESRKQRDNWATTAAKVGRSLPACKAKYAGHPVSGHHIDNDTLRSLVEDGQSWEVIAGRMGHSLRTVKGVWARRSWTKAEDEQLGELLASGIKSSGRLAQVMNRGQGQIVSKIRGVRAWTARDHEELYATMRRGQSWKQAAAAMGCSIRACQIIWANRPWMESEDGKLRRLVSQGVSTYQVAARLDFTWKSVARRLGELGLRS